MAQFSKSNAPGLIYPRFVAKRAAQSNAGPDREWARVPGRNLARISHAGVRTPFCRKERTWLCSQRRGLTRGEGELKSRVLLIDLSTSVIAMLRQLTQGTGHASTRRDHNDHRVRNNAGIA